MGADRVVNSVAARERYGAPVIVVDFGTSTNFDVVGADGAYLGGAIAPGLIVATEALTARRRRVAQRRVSSRLGRRSGRARSRPSRSGALYGHAGLVDGIMERLVAEIGGEVSQDRHRRPGLYHRAPLPQRRDDR